MPYVFFQFLFRNFFYDLKIIVDSDFVVILDAWNHYALTFSLSLFSFLWNKFFGFINLLENLYFIISLEALFEGDAWNCQRSWKCWNINIGWLMGWQRWTRELSQFESLDWSQGTKCVWTHPSYWWHKENDEDF